MSSLEILYYSLAVGFLILVTLVSLVCYYLIRLIRSVQRVVDNIKDASNEVVAVKEGLKFGTLMLINKVIHLVRGGG